MELTRVTIVNRAQIEHYWDASAQTYAVLDRPTIMAQDPEKSYQVAFEVRKVGRGSIRGLTRNDFRAFRGCPDLPKIDTWEKNIEQTEGFWGERLSL
jgi:hypothetical protein